MIIGAVIAALLWAVSLIYSVVTLKPWERINYCGSLFFLIALAVVGVAFGATVQLIQGTL